MDTRSSAIRMAAAFFLVMVFPSVSFSSPVSLIYGGDFNLPIPKPDDPNSEYGMGQMDDAIVVVPESFLIQDIDVALELTHGAFFDLQIFLQSPAGTGVVLNPAGNLAFIVEKDGGGLEPVGGAVQWFFDDEAEVSIEQATEPYSGPYQPVELLSDFDGESVFGEWRLHIRDWWPAHTGTLESFKLVFTAPEPATAVLLLLGSGLIAMFKPRRGY